MGRDHRRDLVLVLVVLRVARRGSDQARQICPEVVVWVVDSC